MEYVEWLDHVTLDGWHPRTESEEQRPALHRSVGFLVREDEESLTLCQTEGIHDDQVGESLVIVKSAIVRREQLQRTIRPQETVVYQHWSQTI